MRFPFKAIIGASAASVSTADKHHARTKRIEELEKALKKLNFGQGLGFTVGGTVINVHTLTQMGAKIATGLFACIPVIIGLRYQPSIDASAHAACSLTATQASMLRSFAELALGNATETCSFRNVTLEAILHPPQH